MPQLSLPPVVAEPIARSGQWTGRIAGLDLARAIALIGMFAAHVGDAGTRGDDADGWHWLWIADGRSSAIFAVLAGITISLMLAKDASGLGHAAVRVATRGVLLMGAGYALGAFGTSVDVILTNLGLMFVLVISLMRWSTPTLLAAAALAATIGSFVARQASDRLDGMPVIAKLVSEHYPAIAWAAYVLVGMAIGKSDLRAPRKALTLVWIGSLTAAASYAAGILCGGAAPWSGGRAASAVGATWASVAPHSNTSFEIIGNTGVALVVIGVCVAATRPSLAILPLLAFGSMSLTMYTAHVLIIAFVGGQIVWQPSNVALVAMTTVLIAAATVWRIAVGAGPLERVLTRASTGVADAVTRLRPSRTT